jgi:hypothetical protein
MQPGIGGITGVDSADIDKQVVHGHPRVAGPNWVGSCGLRGDHPLDREGAF